MFIGKQEENLFHLTCQLVTVRGKLTLMSPKLKVGENNVFVFFLILFPKAYFH